MAEESSEGPKALPINPPWPPRWYHPYGNIFGLKKPYPGQAAWWAEPGYEDHWVKQGRYPIWRYKFKEQDPYYWDAPVKESRFGWNGQDTKHTLLPHSLVDHPGNVHKHREKLRDGSYDIQQIRSKWEISKEHPGLAFTPDVTSSYGTLRDSTSTGHIGLGLSRYGPKYFNAPQGQECHIKSLAAAKWMFFFALPYSVHRYTIECDTMQNWAVGTNRSWRFWWLVKWHFKKIHMPMFHAFCYGGTVCALTAIRQQDDLINPVLAGLVNAAVGFVKTGSPSAGVRAGAVWALLGFLWQCGRAIPNGHNDQRYFYRNGYFSAQPEEIRNFFNTKSYFYGSHKVTQEEYLAERQW